MKRLPYIVILLLVLCGCVSKSRYETMRRGLDSINERNRNDQPFTVSDVQPFVDFFDSHGEPNDQMLAYYLLGRAYYDNGEAPMALKYYQQAVECADTTSEDCNYAQLSRVYGQMGQVYYQQHLFQPLLQTVFSAIDYAFMAEDTIAAMSYYWQKCSAYEQTGRRENAIAVLDTLAIWYLEHGDIQQSAIAKGRASTILVDMNENEKAREYMSVYEQSSGLFDANGNVMLGREIYYYYKGIMFLNLNMTDSAEFYFRKELSENKDFNNQNSGARGLAELFHKLHQPDSASKYSLYAYVMNDSMYAQMSTEEISRMMSMFDYTRNQEIARKKSHEVKIERTRRYISIGITVLIMLLCSGIVYGLHRKERKGLRLYKETLLELKDIRTEKEMLKRHESEFRQLIDNKDIKIKCLEKRMSKYGRQIYFSTANAERCLKESATYKRIEDIAIKGQFLSTENWEIINMLITEYFPGFDDFMTTNKPRLKQNESRICILLRLHFKPVDITGMLKLSKSQVSQISTDIMRKLFEEKGSSKDLSAKLAKIF